MTLTLDSEIQHFIEEEIRTGRYPTAEAVIEAAIKKLRSGDEDTSDDAIDAELDPETIAAINEGEAQGDRGEGIDFDTFRAQWNAKLGRE